MELRDLLAVDLHDRDALQEARVELVIGVDVDLAELEATHRRAKGDDDVARLVAQVTALPCIERHDGHAAAVHARYSGYGAASTKRAAEAIIAALSVHSSSGTSLRRSPRFSQSAAVRSRRRVLAATPPPSATACQSPCSRPR